MNLVIANELHSRKEQVAPQGGATGVIIEDDMEGSAGALKVYIGGCSGWGSYVEIGNGMVAVPAALTWAVSGHVHLRPPYQNDSKVNMPPRHATMSCHHATPCHATPCHVPIHMPPWPRFV